MTDAASYSTVKEVNSGVSNENVRASNRELLIRISSGDTSAMDELVEVNMGLVRKAALHFVSSGVELEDLTQIGVIGMIKAAKSFDFSFETTFSTYAVPMIMGEIRRFIRDNGTVKVGRELKSRGSRIVSFRESFLKERGREPRLSEIAEAVGLCEQDVIMAIEATSAVCSLNDSVGGDGDELTLEGSIPDKENGIEQLTDKLALAEAIRSLPPLWREIVVLRYYKDLSQSETGKRLGITQVKVSREEQKILNTLRHALA